MLGFDREQMIALAALGLTLLLCITGTGFALQVRSQAAADLADKQDLLERLETRAKSAPGAREATVKSASPAAFVDAATPGLAGADLQAYLAEVMLAEHAVLVSSGVQPATRDDPPETIRVQAVVTATLPALQALLYKLEAGTPFVFVDSLVLQLPSSGGTQVENPVLRATLDMHALWHKRPA